MATTTVRLPEPLKAEADELASSLGISLNALMAVALRDYIGRPTMPRSGAPSPSPAPRSAPASSPAATFKAPKSRSDPCPCGALDKRTGYPLKWKQCHGLTSSSKG